MPAWFGPGPAEKGLPHGRHLAAGLPVLLRSWSNTLVSVRQVAQRNTGRETAGIDGEVALTAPARMALAVRVHRSIRTWKPLPVKRVYVPKANAKLRPLGIPVLMDRCHQARAKNALEPEWEARFEPRSYGFRPGRSCQDAIEAIYDTCKGRGATRVWTLDADLAAAFDKLDHSHLLSAIGSFPGREMIRAWLTAGVFEPGLVIGRCEPGGQAARAAADVQDHAGVPDVLSRVPQDHVMDRSVEHGLQRAEVVTRRPVVEPAGISGTAGTRASWSVVREQIHAGPPLSGPAGGRAVPAGPDTLSASRRRPGSGRRARGASRKPGPTPDASC